MNTLKRDLKIALLLGGPGAEREVSLVSGNSVYDALCRAGFTDVTKVDVHGPDFRLPEGTELAYNSRPFWKNAAFRIQGPAPVPAPCALTNPNPRKYFWMRGFPRRKRKSWTVPTAS